MKMNARTAAALWATGIVLTSCSGGESENTDSIPVAVCDPMCALITQVECEVKPTMADCVAGCSAPMLDCAKEWRAVYECRVAVGPQAYYCNATVGITPSPEYCFEELMAAVACYYGDR